LSERKFSRISSVIKSGELAEQNIVDLVAGLPLNLGWHQSQQTQRARVFSAQNLKRRLACRYLLVGTERGATQACHP